MTTWRKIRYWLRDRWVLILYMRGKPADPELAENIIRHFNITGYQSKDVRKICR